MSEVADLVRKLTPAQVRLLKALRPVAGAKGQFSYPAGRGIRAGLQSGWALARRGLVERDPAMPGRLQHHENRSRGLIKLTDLGQQVLDKVIYG